MSKKLGLPELNDFVDKVSDLIKTKRDKAEFEQYRASHRFDIEKLPPDNSDIFFLNGVPIGARENVVAITGRAKSRKTVIASALATSVFLKPGENFLGFSCDIAESEKILHIDTEQGYKHYYQSVKRIFDNAGLTVVPERFESVSTRDAEVEFRIELIEYLIESLMPAVVVLDGVTDLVYDINNQDEATRVGGKLLSWSSRYNCLIIVVIHETKTTGFMTGAFGTWLEKKSQTVLKVTKDEKLPEISHVSCQYARDKPFPDFSIEFDEISQKYVIVNDQRVTTKGATGNKAPEAYPAETHELIIKRAYNVRHAYSDFEIKNALIKAIRQVTNDEVGSRNVKSWVDYYHNNGIIFKHPENDTWQRVEIHHMPGEGSLFDATHESPIDDIPF